MKMEPSLHLVSDQTSADEVRGLTADFEELVHAEHERLFPALALITRDPASPSLRPKLRRKPGLSSGEGTSRAATVSSR